MDPMDATPAPVNSSFSPDGRLLPTPHQMTPNLEAVLPDTRKPSLPAFQPLSREAAVPVFQMPVAATTSKTSRPTPSKTVFPKVDNEEKRSVLEAIVEEFLETECKRVLRETFIEEISLMDSMEAIMGEVIATQTKKVSFVHICCIFNFCLKSFFYFTLFPSSMRLLFVAIMQTCITLA